MGSVDYLLHDRSDLEMTCLVKDLKGGEILTSQVLTEDLQVLLEAGEVIQEKQIERLKQYGIVSVNVIPAIGTTLGAVRILKEETTGKLKAHVRDTLTRYHSGSDDELRSLETDANDIIDSVMEDMHVSEKVYEIKSGSEDIYEHVVNVSALSTLLALKLELPKVKVQAIALAALLHDIAIPQTMNLVMGQKFDDYSHQDQLAFKKHPTDAYTMLMDCDWIPDLSKKIILYHHECRDGSGFPMKVRNLGPEAELMQICDLFDDMISGIGCPKIKVFRALDYFRVNRKGKYRADLVDMFLNFVASYPVGTIVLTNEGETGVVIRQNKEFSDRPVIKILKDKNGKEREGNVVKDLLQENTIFIEDCM